MHGDPNTASLGGAGSWWRTNHSRTISRTKLGLAVKDAALGLPIQASRALNVARYLPMYLSDPGLRREWRAEDAVERAFLAGGRFAIPLDERSASTSERTVEIPWVMSRVRFDPGQRVLDIGSTFARHSYRRLLAHAAGQVELHLVDLTRCAIPGALAHEADARALPFDEASFDSVTCISTLEHIGMDNAAYGVAPDAAEVERPDIAALRELGRVARRDPGVLVTVPAGRTADFGWFRQYSPATWVEVVETAGLDVHELAFFVHTTAGWRAANAAEVESRSYGEGAPAAAALICARLFRTGSPRASA